MANNTSCRINTIEMYASWRSGGFGGWPAHLNMKLRKRKVFRITHSVEFKQRSMKFAYPIPVPLLIAISVLVTVYCQRINCALKYLSLELRRLCLILFQSGAIIVPYVQHFQSSGSSIVSWSHLIQSLLSKPQHWVLDWVTINYIFTRSIVSLYFL